ncbi:MAG: hypothetical protein EOO04_17650 [Chitinophagaceae bacterium]|nr:MAG: hypothetical protein EOO04_17650 [Chitinophagaceae bacterium]
MFCLSGITGCVRQVYLQSPLQATDHAYRAIPMVSDGIKNSVYASGSIVAGGGNQNLRDGVFQFQGSVHRAHTWSRFQAYYGLSGMIGNYHISQHSVYSNFGYFITTQGPLNRYTAALGAFGGAGFVIPFGSGSEWRVFGVETSYQHELGDYLHYRLKLPDSAATIISRNNYFHTIGMSTNVIKKFRKSGNTFGYKFGVHMSTSRLRRLNTYDSFEGKYLLPAFVSNTLHLTRRRVTYFAQINAGTFALNMQTGINVKLAR